MAERQKQQEATYILNKLEELYQNDYFITGQTLDIQLILSEFDFDPINSEIQPSREEVIDLLVENREYLDVLKELPKEELRSTIYNAIEAKDKKIFFEEIVRKIERGEIKKRKSNSFIAKLVRDQRRKKEEKEKRVEDGKKGEVTGESEVIEKPKEQKREEIVKREKKLMP